MIVNLELYFSKESYIPIPWQQFLPVLVTIPSTAKGAGKCLLHVQR